jgi:RHS repeat-associated protein
LSNILNYTPDVAIGLYFYNARYYDPALGRFVQADTIVPSPGDPQALNRYSYCLGNPVRYRDPTGRYSEDEIMQSFGVSTWDEVLAHFREGGSLEGRWGWLETLRKAQDGDAVIERNPAQVRWYRGGLWPLQCEAGALCGSINGTFGRNEQGEILVSGRAHGEFALRGDEYALYKRNAVIGGHAYDASFETAADWIHYHPKFDPSGVNWTDVALDSVGAVASFVGANPVVEAFQIAPKVAKGARLADTGLNIYGLTKAILDLDVNQTILAGGGFLPGPIGGGFNLASLYFDLEEGYYYTP